MTAPAPLAIRSEERSTVRETLTWLWAIRRCTICNLLGACEHREPHVDLAELEAAARRLRKPAGRER